VSFAAIAICVAYQRVFIVVVVVVVVVAVVVYFVIDSARKILDTPSYWKNQFDLNFDALIT
jgi:hypothetical protein